ncbi:hypothetical protein [Egicoccus sp. AB-alg2]|uniref:hypothetical protein n=1 Tax=Egicoccus sp. AB-alg2 TaxID=3242693 RepID=UPI00359E541C
MLASISPVGEASRGQRWTVTAIAYLVASTVGGATVGALAGGVGWLAARGLTGFGVTPPGDLVLAILAIAGLLALAADAGRLPVRLPSWQRQVDERWLTAYRGWVYGAGFGFQLGAAVLTRIPTAATHLLLLFAVASASAPIGALLGATFGLVRALPLLTTAGLREPAGLQRFHRRLDAGAPLAQRLTALTVGAAVAVLAVGTVV